MKYFDMAKTGKYNNITKMLRIRRENEKKIGKNKIKSK